MNDFRPTVSDPLQSGSDPGSWWSTTNLGEALPGVLTPLSWSVWSGPMERTVRGAFHSIGVLSRREIEVPAREEERVFSIFYGRAAVRGEFMCLMGDRLPGTSGTAVAAQLFTAVPPGFVDRPDPRYYPWVAIRFPATAVRAPSAVRRARPSTELWWRGELRRIPTLGYEEARRSFAAALTRFEDNVRRQGFAVLTVVQPVFDQLTRLLAAAGADAGPELMRGYGAHEETRMVADLWDCSRDSLSLEEFLDRHGYHGPSEGEIAGVMWREDPSPLHNILAGYRALKEAADPGPAEEARIAERRKAEHDLLATVSITRRAWVKIILGLASHHVPLRGVGKVAFLQSLDVVRAAARRLGVILADQSVFADPSDIFFLTAEEIRAGQRDVRELVAFRRERRTAYEKLELPSAWQGFPDARPIGLGDGTPMVLEGIGVSAGLAAGRVRVMSEPGDAPMEPGEILVAHTTDPSWASVLFLASALVVDIGGLLSHAAVVARELGVPCVVNVKVATTALRTGDVCRVDGGTGRIEVLQRVPNPEPP